MQGSSQSVSCCHPLPLFPLSALYLMFPMTLLWGFPVMGGSAGKKICLQCGRPGFDPWVGKIPWGRERLPTPVFWPGDFHGLCSTAAAAKSLQSCPTLCDPRDDSPQGFPIPGILQARTLEWVAISFSNV